MKRLYLPDNLNLAERCPHFNDRELDYAHWFVSQILFRFNALKHCSQGFVGIHRDVLRTVIPKEKRHRIIGSLCAKRIVDENENYLPMSFPKSYRLADEFVDADYSLQPLRTEYVSNKIERLPRYHEQVPDQPIHQQLSKQLSRLRICDDVDDFVSGQLELKQRGQARISIATIKDRIVRYHVDSYGRVHTVVSNLNSRLRPFLRVNDEPLAEHDVTNSQPLLLVPLVRSWLAQGRSGVDFPPRMPRHEPSDLVRFADLANNGKLYEEIAGDISTERRKEVKKTIFEKVLFGRITKRKAPILKTFISMFPTVWEFICFLKQDDYRLLAHTLQRLESTIIIHDCCSQILSLRPDTFIATIHDSLLCKLEDSSFVEQEMRNSFSKYNLSPALSHSSYP